MHFVYNSNSQIIREVESKSSIKTMGTSLTMSTSYIMISYITRKLPHAFKNNDLFFVDTQKISWFQGKENYYPVKN